MTKLVKSTSKRLIVAMVMAGLFAIIPSVINSFNHLNTVLTPAEEYIEIAYIQASDVDENGYQYMTMCSNVDKDRASIWTWELSKVLPDDKQQRISSEAISAITESVPNCIKTWNSIDDKKYQEQMKKLNAGNYKWSVIVTFDVAGVTKQTQGFSNVFNKEI